MTLATGAELVADFADEVVVVVGELPTGTSVLASLSKVKQVSGNTAVVENAV